MCKGADFIVSVYGFCLGEDVHVYMYKSNAIIVSTEQCDNQTLLYHVCDHVQIQ